MVHKRQSLRLRIPWLFAPSSRVSKTEDKSKFPTHLDTNVPIQRPVSPPKQPSAVIESSVPSQTTPTQFHSPLPPLQPSSQASSPSRVSIASSSPKTRPQSPFHLASDGIVEVAKPAAEESFWPASSAFEQEKEKVVSKEPMPQEADSPLKAITKSPETTFQPEKMEIQPQDTQQNVSSVLSTPVSKTESASDHPPPPPSSPLASEHTGEVLKRDVDESTLPQEEKGMVEAVSEPVLQESESNMKSPLKTIPKPPETSFHHEKEAAEPQDSEQQASFVPQFNVSETKPASDQPPHPSSHLASKLVGEVLKSTEESSLPASSASQEEKEKMAVAASELMPQDVEPKMKSPLKAIPKSLEISTKPELLYTQPTSNIGDVERSPKPGSSKAPLQTQSKLLPSKEKKKEVHEPIKARKAKDPSTAQPNRHSMASASGTKAKEPFTRPFHADKKQHGARETVSRRLVFSTSKLREEDMKFTSSEDQRTRTVSGISPEKAPLQKVIKDDVSKFVHKLATVDPIGIKGDISKFVHKLATVNPKQTEDDKQYSVITLAGDNRGATMQLDSEAAKQERSILIHQDYKDGPEERTEVTTDVEENTENDGVGKAYVNSNIQSINNSLMVHGSITESEPGVQLTFPQNPAEDLETY